MGASTPRPHSLILAILAVVLMSAGGLVAWAARPPRRRAPPPTRRPHVTRPVRPAPRVRARARVHPLRPRPVVRVVPRVAPVIIHDTEPEIEELIRDPDSLPPTSLETFDGEGDGESPAPRACPVTAVGDGLTVTVKIDGQETPVRLLGVAEAKTAEGDLPLSPEAFLRNLVSGEFVRLVADETLDETDEEGRRVAYVYRMPDGLLVNLELVRQGYAVTAREYAFDQLDAFLIYQRRARADHRGLWATVADPLPAAPVPAVEEVAREASAE